MLTVLIVSTTKTITIKFIVKDLGQNQLVVSLFKLGGFLTLTFQAPVDGDQEELAVFAAQLPTDNLHCWRDTPIVKFYNLLLESILHQIYVWVVTT